MKVVFAPSGKRMIPYPPVAPAVLAASLRRNEIDATVVDLEIETWLVHQRDGFWPEDRSSIDPYKVLSEGWTTQSLQFAEALAQLMDYVPGEPVAISTMGYEQLAGTIGLVKLALENDSEVILGGQFWTENTGERVLNMVRDTRLTIVIHDGYEAIVQWRRSKETPINSLRWVDGDIVKGETKKALTTPPQPYYDDTNWPAYEAYAATMLGATEPVRRAHLYVWDKQCPYKCTFCRVSTGSNVKLSSPESVAESMMDLLRHNVRQLNFMTNEINPTLTYMRRFIKALEPSLKDNEDVAWFTYMRPDYVAPEDFVNLRRLGCRLVRYGVETGSQRLSNLMRKEYTITTIEEVLKSASDAGILNHVNFLVGFPGENEDDIEESLKFIDRAAPYIQSVRINPFYLPPDSPMARSPEENGIRLKDFKKGFWDFELLDGSRTGTDVIENRISRISDRIKSHGIGFSGVLPFETLDFISRYESRDEAIADMKIQRPYMWESSSADWLKGQMGGYKAPIEWQASIYQRGKNYSLALCND